MDIKAIIEILKGMNKKEEFDYIDCESPFHNQFQKEWSAISFFFNEIISILESELDDKEKMSRLKAVLESFDNITLIEKIKMYVNQRDIRISVGIENAYEYYEKGIVYATKDDIMTFEEYRSQLSGATNDVHAAYLIYKLDTMTRLKKEKREYLDSRSRELRSFGVDKIIEDIRKNNVNISFNPFQQIIIVLRHLVDSFEIESAVR